MPSRRDTLDRRLSEAKAAADQSKHRVRQASAERLTRALAAPTPREQLAALDDPILVRTDRRRLREKVGVSLAPPARSMSGLKRDLPARLRLRLARWRPNPFHVVVSGLAAGALVATIGLAWSHTGRGVVVTRACGPVQLVMPDASSRSLVLQAGTQAVLRGREGATVRIALWAPRAGYATALVPQDCLALR